MPQHVHGEFYERIECDLDADSEQRKHVRGLERGLHGSRQLRGDDERGGKRDGDV